jgi:hypothetical protein
MLNKLEHNFIGTGQVKGFIFDLADESEKYYIYQVRTPENNIHFEMFEKRTVSICVDFENRIYSETEFKEIYPKENDFGVWAWTFKTLDECFKSSHFNNSITPK